MEHNAKQQNNPTIENYYGQFVAFSDNNEIMCYSRNGKPIYYAENPPASPVKNKLSNPDRIHIEEISIPKYKNMIDTNPHKSHSIFGILYGIIATCVFLVIFLSLYVMFFE